MPDWFWFVVSPLVFLGYGYYVWQQRRQRRDSYAKVAQRLGWQYVAADRSLLGTYDGDPFEWGHWKKIEHHFTGEHRGRRVTAFEYSSRMKTVNSSGHERTERYFYQVLTVRLPGPHSSLEIEARGFFSRVARALGWPSFETNDPDFDEAFKVSTDDRVFAAKLLTDEVRESLLADPRAQDTPLRINGYELITWRPGNLDVDDLHPRLDFLCDFLDKTIPAEW